MRLIDEKDSNFKMDSFIAFRNRIAIIRECTCEISGESCSGGQVIAFGLGIGFFLHKKHGLAHHDVVMAKPLPG